MRDILANRAFVRAALTSFFFFTSQNGFVLLPLCGKQLGGLAHARGYAPMWLALTALVLVGSLVSMGLERPAAASG